MPPAAGVPCWRRRIERGCDMSNLEKTVIKTFLEMAESLKNGSYGVRPKIALTGMGGEHGEENAVAAAQMAAKRGMDVYYIGTL